MFLGAMTYMDYLANRCKHILKDKAQIKVFEEVGSSMPSYNKYVKECTKCGTIKVFKT